GNGLAGAVNHTNDVLMPVSIVQDEHHAGPVGPRHLGEYGRPGGIFAELRRRQGDDSSRRQVVIHDAQRLTIAGARDHGLVQRLGDVIGNRLFEDGQGYYRRHQFDSHADLQLVVAEADLRVDDLLLLICDCPRGHPGCHRLSGRDRDLHTALDARFRDPRPDATSFLHLLDDTIEDGGRNDGADIAQAGYRVSPEFKNVGLRATGDIIHKRLAVLHGVVPVDGTGLHSGLLHQRGIDHPDFGRCPGLDASRHVSAPAQLLLLIGQLLQLLFQHVQVSLLIVLQQITDLSLPGFDLLQTFPQVHSLTLLYK